MSSLGFYPFQGPLFFHFSAPFLSKAWKDFLADEKLHEEGLLRTFQLIPKVGPGPEYRKGIYAGGGEGGALQAPTLLENYFIFRLASPTMATSKLQVGFTFGNLFFAFPSSFLFLALSSFCLFFPLSFACSSRPA